MSYKLSPEVASIERSRAEFHHRGYCMWHTEDVEEDNIKLWHHVLTPDNTLTYVDWSPYSTMTEQDFQMWIDLGMPGRVQTARGSHNLDTKDLLAMKVAVL